MNSSTLRLFTTLTAALCVAPFAACGSHQQQRNFRTTSAAAVFAATAAAGIAGAFGRGPKPGGEAPPCPAQPAPPVATEGCLVNKPQRHEPAERCTYYCLDHCSYHVITVGPATQPR